MNIKNIMFSALMIGAAFTSSFAVAGVPPMTLDLEKAATVVVAGTGGAAALCVLGAQKGAAVGAVLGSAGGPIGTLVGGAVGIVVGGAAGAAAGYVGFVMTKAVYNEFKKSH